MLDLIDRNISAQEIAHLCLEEPRRGEFLCPSCNGPLTLERHYAACHSGSCEFVAGAPIDLLAAKSGYREAVETMAASFGSVLPGLDGVAIRQTADRAQARRRLLTGLLDCVTDHSVPGSIDRIEAAGWFRSIEVDLAIQPRSAILLTPSQWAQYRAALEAWDPTIRIPKVAGRSTRQCIVVIPYFSAPGRLSSLLLTRTGNPLDLRKLHLCASRFSFTGLLDLHPAHTDPLVCRTFPEAARLNTANADFARDQFAVAIMHRPDCAADMQWRPGRLRCGLDDSLGNTAVLSDLARAFPAVWVEVANQPVRWDQYAADHAFRCAMADGSDFEPEFRALKLPDTAVTELLKRLMDAGALKAATRVEAMMRNRLLFVEGDTEYHQDGEHYVAIRSDGRRTILSNFTVELERNVVFADSRIFAHAGGIVFGGQKTPCVITTAAINSLAEIQSAAQIATCASGAGGDTVPMFQNCQTARALLGWFRNCLSALPRVEGLDCLGWNDERTAFFSPWGKVMESKITEVRIPNPNHKFWGHFQLGMEPGTAVIPELPAALRDLCGQLVAICGRAYAHLPERAVMRRQTGRAQAFLTSVFSAIGQTRPIVTAVRDAGSRKFLEGVSGFPLLLICQDGDGMRQGGVVLGETGGDVETVELPDLGFLRYLMSECCAWMMRTKGVDLKIFNSIDPGVALIREGAHIIRQAMGIEWVESHPVSSTMEEFLNTIAPARVPEFFTHDLLAQTFEIEFSGSPGLLDDAIVELSHRCKKIRRDGTMLVVDAIGGIDLLKDFYGTMPQVRRKQTPEDLGKTMSQ